MLKKITVEEAAMLIVKKETSKLYVKQKYMMDNKPNYAHISDTVNCLLEPTSQEFWLMTDDE